MHDKNSTDILDKAYKEHSDGNDVSHVQHASLGLVWRVREDGFI